MGSYALFLKDIRKDYDKAEMYYVRALNVDPGHSNALGNYALFLQEIRKDSVRAETYFIQSLKADPWNANLLGNYARYLLETERTNEGLLVLDQAFAAPEADISQLVAVELHMYAVCHRLPEIWRASLSGLKKLLIENKITTGDWDFSKVIASAKLRGHPAAEWLESLAAVCAGMTEASTLEGWEDWKRA